MQAYTDTRVEQSRHSDRRRKFEAHLNLHIGYLVNEWKLRETNPHDLEEAIGLSFVNLNELKDHH